MTAQAVIGKGYRRVLLYRLGYETALIDEMAGGIIVVAPGTVTRPVIRVRPIRARKRPGESIGAEKEGESRQDEKRPAPIPHPHSLLNSGQSGLAFGKSLLPWRM